MVLLPRVAAVVAAAYSCLQPFCASTMIARQNGAKIMIVGDSISHGSEGDCKCASYMDGHLGN